MWKNIYKIILNNRILIVFLILVLTVFFGFFATKIKLQYQINKLLPDNDSTFIAYKNFKSNFGKDGCLLYTSPSPRDRTRSRMPSSA